MESNDKDLRFMAAKDLLAELAANKANMDERLENKVQLNLGVF